MPPKVAAKAKAKGKGKAVAEDKSTLASTAASSLAPDDGQVAIVFRMMVTAKDLTITSINIR